MKGYGLHGVTNQRDADGGTWRCALRGPTILGVVSALTLDLVILASIALSPWFSFYNTS